MSTFRFVYNEGSLEGICAVCLAMQKGWTYKVLKERLDRIDKDGKQGLVEIELVINSNLPFDHSVTVYNGAEVCIGHAPTIPYAPQKAAGLFKPQPPQLIIPG